MTKLYIKKFPNELAKISQRSDFLNYELMENFLNYLCEILERGYTDNYDFRGWENCQEENELMYIFERESKVLIGDFDRESIEEALNGFSKSRYIKPFIELV